MIKFSRQRESIKNNLMGRTDHPTAETVYSDIRQEYPNISLGTVYRNLSLLADLGEIQKISTENGPDRFDGNPKPHYHFFCTNCNSVLDLKMKNIDLINVIAAEEFAGLIEGHIPDSTDFVRNVKSYWINPVLCRINQPILQKIEKKNKIRKS